MRDDGHCWCEQQSPLNQVWTRRALSPLKHRYGGLATGAASSLANSPRMIRYIRCDCCISYMAVFVNVPPVRPCTCIDALFTLYGSRIWADGFCSLSGRDTMIPLHVWSYDWFLKYWGRSHCSHTVPWLSSMGISWSVHPWEAQDAVTLWRSDFRVFFAHVSHRLWFCRVASAKFGVHNLIMRLVGHLSTPDSENWFHLWLPVPWVSCWPFYRIGKRTFDTK